MLYFNFMNYTNFEMNILKARPSYCCINSVLQRKGGKFGLDWELNLGPQSGALTTELYIQVKIHSPYYKPQLLY